MTIYRIVFRRAANNKKEYFPTVFEDAVSAALTLARITYQYENYNLHDGDEVGILVEEPSFGGGEFRASELKSKSIVLF